MRHGLALIGLALALRCLPAHGEPPAAAMRAIAPPFIGAPQAAISGPSRVDAGDMAVFKFTGAGKGLAWDFYPPADRHKFVVISNADGTQSVLFASRKPGTYGIVCGVAEGDRCSVLFWPFVNAGQPTPDPSPNPGPTPDPTPQPTPVGKRAVVVVEESAQRSPAQAAVYASKRRMDYFAAQGHQWFLLDKDAVDAFSGGVVPWQKPYFDKAATMTLPVVFVVEASSGKLLDLGPLPATAEALLTLLQKHGG